LHVVQMDGWERSMLFDQTGLRWINPSPSIRTLHTAVVYPGTCLLEGTSVSEGRGTDRPFEYLGAPWISGGLLAKRLNVQRLPGVRFQAIRFVPRGSRLLTTEPKYEGQVCGGIFVRVTHRKRFEPVRTALFIFSTLQELYPQQFRIRSRRFDELAGTRQIRKGILDGTHPDRMISSWQTSLHQFAALRRRYLLYR
ncbi:MAG: DUF1343 domain-containing protein, partial [Ignavibacteria bacterium]|nr:DUF1343 domain-containing protein [Ignavibacteria bacterium]